jgi:hypothetical protein
MLNPPKSFRKINRACSPRKRCCKRCDWSSINLHLDNKTGLTIREKDAVYFHEMEDDKNRGLWQELLQEIKKPYWFLPIARRNSYFRYSTNGLSPM